MTFGHRLTHPTPTDTVHHPCSKHTPFHAFHVSAGAKMVDFAGWEMPILYRGILDEHEQTRKSGSLFDVSHMGVVDVHGGDAAAYFASLPG